MIQFSPTLFKADGTLACLKAYDIRGIMPEELNPQLAFYLGCALAKTQPDVQTVVLGMDSRLSSPELLQAVAAGLTQHGVACVSLGLCGTEEVYYAAGGGHGDLGVMITASHNPIEYNGMKLVKRGGVPFDPSRDLKDLDHTARELIGSPVPLSFPLVPALDVRAAYVDHLLSLVDVEAIPAQKIVINAGHGAAGPTADAILARLPQLEVVRLFHEPDGTFPAGIPNPLLPENRAPTARAVVETHARMGIAWDGDFDRCFLYDETGTFVSGYAVASLLVEATLHREPGATIVHDPRLYWATVDAIDRFGGQAVIAKVGHGFIKPAMRSHHSPFAGEISGHFYFRDFFTCDTGMLPWLMILQLLGQRGQTLGQAVADLNMKFPASDEFNFKTPMPAKAFLATLEDQLLAMAPSHERVDGLSLTDTPTGWRANIRTSSNEPLLRLNVEARNPAVLERQLHALQNLIKGAGAVEAGGH
jgi:phosphomannomutase